MATMQDARPTWNPQRAAITIAIVTVLALFVGGCLAVANAKTPVRANVVTTGCPSGQVVSVPMDAHQDKGHAPDIITTSKFDGDVGAVTEATIEINPDGAKAGYAIMKGQLMRGDGTVIATFALQNPARSVLLNPAAARPLPDATYILCIVKSP